MILVRPSQMHAIMVFLSVVRQSSRHAHMLYSTHAMAAKGSADATWLILPVMPYSARVEVRGGGLLSA